MLTPVLPPELECTIFELAAWHDRATTLKLVFVARRVHIWIGPLRWRVLVLSETVSLQNMPPDGSTHIRHLALAGVSASPAETEKFLSKCPNITNISLWSGDITPSGLRQLHQPTKLTHLSTNLTHLLQENSDSALVQAQLAPLRTVSHLELFGERPTPTILPIIFRLLPALTHLAFAEGMYAPEVFKAVLQAGDASLRLLVVICEDRNLNVVGPGYQPLAMAVAEEEMADSRFCVVECFDYTEDWVLGAWGGRDFWSRAEERSAMRARALQNGSAA